MYQLRKYGSGILVLRIVLGFVLLAESILLLKSGHPELPNFIRLLLGWSEAVASLLFLLPATMEWGGRCLLIVFAAAALLHILHGQFNIGALLVYGAAVFAVLQAKSGLRKNRTE